MEKNAIFAERQSFPFDLLCDTDRTISVAYHAARPDSTDGPRRISYLIDSEGHISHAFKRVNPALHPAEVLAALDLP